MQQESKLLVNLTRGSLVCEELLVADTARRRMRGLLGRGSLAAGEGMLLHPAPSIHTAFMRFSIDALFLDGTLRVKRIVADMPPWRMASTNGAWAVLEIGAGEAERCGVSVGDRLGVVEMTDRTGEFIVTRGSINRRDSPVPPVAGRSSTPPEDPVADERHPLATSKGTPLRVLVVSTDRRFRALAGVLLTRRGCSVSLHDGTPELVPHEAVDAVVLDVSAGPTEHREFATAIRGRPHPSPVVLVGDEDASPPAPERVLSKWGSFDELYAALVEAAKAGPAPEQEVHGARR